MLSLFHDLTWTGVAFKSPGHVLFYARLVVDIACRVLQLRLKITTTHFASNNIVSFDASPLFGTNTGTFICSKLHFFILSLLLLQRLLIFQLFLLISHLFLAVEYHEDESGKHRNYDDDKDKNDCQNVVGFCDIICTIISWRHDHKLRILLFDWLNISVVALGCDLVLGFVSFLALLLGDQVPECTQMPLLDWINSIDDVPIDFFSARRSCE